MKKIVITVRGGLIEDIIGIPSDTEIEVIDFDVDTTTDNHEIIDGKPAVISVYKGE